MHSAAMGADARNNGESQLTVGWSQVRTFELSAKFVRLAELRRLKKCEQVAAVCYRVRMGVIEFLLVQTGKGRWIFPKGGVEPGLTHAQAAALEAFEEAAFMDGWKRPRSPATFGAAAVMDPGKKSRRSTLIFARSYGRCRRRRRVEIPHGFPPTRRSVGCRKTVVLSSGLSWLGWWTARWPELKAIAADIPRR